jgi:argininosuccinate lyase
MSTNGTGVRTRLSGRVDAAPSALLHEEILRPQFEYDVAHLLPFYLAIEKVLLLEYTRLGLVSAADARVIAAVLDEVDASSLTARPDVNMSDFAFALERHVEERLPAPVPAWHVDRSRNDLQACAQLMFGRDQLGQVAAGLLALGRAAHRLATETADLPMPGFTHLQAAQVITPGFYLAAVVEQALHTLDRFAATYDGIDRCPLGAGAMSGQELDWDRDRMAALLGFRAPQPHALVAVASREWALEITAELSVLGVGLSRFVTDLMAWGSSQYGFLELPDSHSGISAAMPQKKNFPLLERVRGRSAHLSTFHLDVVLGQRGTPFSNMVEVSKEASAHLLTALTTARSTLRLFTEVLDQVRFRPDRMLAACEREHLGGFTLANRLTLREGVPWRTAQVVAGQYVVAAQGRPPGDTDPALLAEVAGRHGIDLTAPADVLAGAFDVAAGLREKRSAGSANPDSVRELLATQAGRLTGAATAWAARGQRVANALAEVDHRLSGDPS